MGLVGTERMGAGATGVIHFDADLIFRALIYHIEEPRWPFRHAIDVVTLDSLFAFGDRMEWSGVSVDVPAAKWRRLSDADRFAWLLKWSRTKFKIIKGTRTGELVEDRDSGTGTAGR